jgi:hypothetical protein
VRRVNFLELGSNVQTSHSQELKVAGWNLESTMVNVMVDVLHREVESLSLEAVVTADELYPVEEHEPHLPSEFSLPHIKG